MPSLLPVHGDCCTPCEETVTVQVPGSQGPPGADGADGVDGYNSYCVVATQYTNPAIGATVEVEVDTSIPLHGVGYAWCDGHLYQVDSIPDATHLVLKLISGVVGAIVPPMEHVAQSAPGSAVFNTDTLQWYLLTMRGSPDNEYLVWSQL